MQDEAAVDHNPQGQERLQLQRCDVTAGHRSLQSESSLSVRRQIRHGKRLRLNSLLCSRHF